MATASRFPFRSDPTGWYHLADAGALAPGDAQHGRALGRDVEIWRDEAGRAHVAGDAREWPVDEVNGSLLAFWDARGRAPRWRVPAFAPCSSPEWTRVAERSWRIRSHPQEIGENIVDTAHILVLHGADRMPELARAEGDGPFFRVESKTPADDPSAAFVSGFRVTDHGLGYAALEFEGAVQLFALARRTPVEGELVDVRVAFYAKRLAEDAATRAIGDAFVARFCAEFDADVPILESKVHWKQPLLCEADGPIAAWRRWARQFYA